MSIRPAVTVGIIGSGNLAWSLCAALQNETFSVEQILSRNRATAKQIADEFGIPSIETDGDRIFPDLDLVFICTPDDSIAKVAESLKGKTGKHTYVVHCSGSADLNRLSVLGERIGVIWPMQTFSFGKIAELIEVPLFIEGSAESLAAIREFAFGLSEKVIFLESPQREKMHLAAVIAGNFSTWLYHEAEQLSKLSGAGDFQLFKPYLEEVLRKSLNKGPLNALTGPAIRGDEKTIQRHETLLQEMSLTDLKNLYSLFSKMIGGSTPGASQLPSQ